MRVAVRVDAGLAMGAGHVMRCLTLADELRDRGAQVRFVTRAHAGHLDDVVRARGHELASLAPAYGDATNEPKTWLGASCADDAAGTLEAIADLGRVDWVVVDHYAIDATWHRVVSRHGRRIMAIDDLGNRPLEVDLLLDQNFGARAERYEAVLARPVRSLLGPDYALIASSIREAATRRRAHEPLGREASVLVSLGGTDPDDVTSEVLVLTAPALALARRIDVVIGRAHPRPERVAEACAELGANLHVQTTAMAELLLAADLAIGGAGSSTWERMCVGVPSIVLALADNQMPALEALSNANLIATPTPCWRQEGALRSLVEHLLTDRPERERLAKAGRRTVDGGGATRVVEAMMVP